MTEADLQLVFDSSGIKELIAEMKALNAAMAQTIAEGGKAEDAVSGIGEASSEASGNVGGLGGAFGNLGGIIASAGLAFGAAEILDLGKAAVQSAINYETLQVQFEVFLGSAEKAKTVLADLNQFSIVTPFTPDEVNNAGRSLLAFGVSSEKLIPTLKMVGDVSSAVGKDFNELAVIYGKARTAGTIFAEDINQLTEAGVPIIEELAKVFGVSADQVKKLGSEGKIHFAELEKAFANMTGEGGRFNGMMDKMSQSTEGLLSTIEGKLQDELRAIGQAMLPTIRTIAEGFEPAFASLKEAFITIFSPLGGLLSSFGELFSIFNIGGSEGNKFANIVSTIATVLKVVTFPAQLVYKAIGFIVEKIVDFVKFSGRVIEKIGSIGSAFDLVLLPMKAVGAVWDELFGDDTNENIGLSAKSMQLWGAAVQGMAQKTGATMEQMRAFQLSFDQSKIAGLSATEATKVVTRDLLKFIEASKAGTAANDELAKSATNTGNQFKYAAGSIGHLEEVLKLMQERYKAATTDLQRIGLNQQIEAIQFKLAKFNNEVERIKPLRLGIEPEKISELEQFNAQLEAVHQTVNDVTQLPHAEMVGSVTDAYIQLGASVELTNEKLTFQGSLLKSLGEGGFAAIKQGLQNLKGAFIDFGTQAAESIGKAIGSGQSVGAAFSKVIQDMLVQVPKIAGMALIQAAAAPDVPSFALRLALLGGGLALVGLSGILGGMQAKANEDQQQQPNLNGIQGTGATLSSGRSSNPQGLGQMAALMPPIQLQVSLDGKNIAQAAYPHLRDERKKRF